MIEPSYPKPGNGRPPIGVARMLRLYFVQQWFNLSDPGVEEALYDSPAMRGVVGIDLGREPVPDETTVCRFRHLLETHGLGRRRFDQVQRHLAENGLQVATGTIVDATIIHAPSATKNRARARDPERHQTKKGNQWYFGLKAHVGLDSRTKLIDAAVATPANVADSRVLPDLLHGRETRVWGDQAYRGQRAVIRRHAPRPGTSPTAAIATAASRPGRARQKPHQVEGAGPGRAFDRGRQTGVRLCQSALSRASQEPASPAGDLRTGQSVHRPPPSAAPPNRVVRLHHPRQLHRPADPTAKPNPVTIPAPGCRPLDRDHPRITRLFRRSLIKFGEWRSPTIGMQGSCSRTPHCDRAIST